MTVDIIAVAIILVVVGAFILIYRSTNKDEAIKETKRETVGLPMTVRDLKKNYTGNAPFQVVGTYKNLLFVPLRKINNSDVSLFVVEFESEEILNDVKPGFFTISINNDEVKLIKFETSSHFFRALFFISKNNYVKLSSGLLRRHFSRYARSASSQ